MCSMKRASSLSVLSGHNTEQGFMSYVLCPQHVRSNVASLRGRTASTEQLLLQNATAVDRIPSAIEAVTPTTQPSRSAVSSTGAGAEFPSSKISNDELQSVNLGVTKVRRPLKLPRLRFRHTCRTVGESMVIVSKEHPRNSDEPNHSHDAWFALPLLVSVCGCGPSHYWFKHLPTIHGNARAVPTTTCDNVIYEPNLSKHAPWEQAFSRHPSCQLPFT
uniref:Uncharacterized protein n=1 Tax=Timema bartmani TaxID=61472 RepID=A0A7R9I0V5_9NEOP|nr:unnamed protein product [Timema bartmani]